MRRIKKIFSVFFLATLCLLFVFGNSPNQESAAEYFEKAFYYEDVQGDLQKAIELYEQILKQFPENRKIAAKAQLQIGICLEKLGLQEAEKAFQKVVDNFPDQAATVKMAREKLATLVGAQAIIQKVEQDLSIQKVWSGPGVDTLGGISPDGKLLTFTDWTTGDLAVRELANGKNRRITDKGPWTKSTAFAFFSKWSMDGQSIAYSWWDPDPEGEHFELRLIGLEESQPRILFEHKVTPAADVFPLDWHPDGKRILCYFGREPDTYELGFISVVDRTVQVLKSFKVIGGIPWNFAISPDGRTIAYDRFSEQDPKNRDIFLLSTDGTHEQRLSGHPASDYVCDWTADGRFLLFGSDRTGVQGLWTVQVKDGKTLGAPLLLKADMGSAYPIGCTLQNQFYYGYRNISRDVYLAEIDPVSGQFLAPPTKKVQLYEGSNVFPEFSPDGKYFVSISIRGFSPRVKYLLCLHSIESDKIRELDSGGLSVLLWSNPQWRPDGKAISLVVKDSQGGYGIYLLELESGKVSPLVLFTKEEAIYRHRWANDGQTLFLTKSENKKPSSIYTYDLKTGEEKVLTSSPDDIRDIDISPDGQWLAFLDRGMKRSLRIVPTAGGAPQRVHSFDVMGRFSITPAWSADGKYIFFSSKANPADTEWDMWRFSLEDKRVIKINPQGVSFKYLSLHPDGRHMIFSTEYEAPSEIWVIENFLPKTKTRK